jgi:hypothetical protein
MEVFSLESILKAKFANVQDQPKVEHEFQDICLQLEEYFGKKKVIWSLPYRKGFTNNTMRDALKECKTRNKPFLAYFIKIILNKNERSLANTNQKSL